MNFRFINLVKESIVKWDLHFLIWHVIFLRILFGVEIEHPYLAKFILELKLVDVFNNLKVLLLDTFVTFEKNKKGACLLNINDKII